MSPGEDPLREGGRLFRPLDAVGDRAAVEGLLRRALPHDYVLGMLDRFLTSGGVVGGFEGERLVAVQRFTDLGDGEGWVGAIRVDPPERRKGWGADLTRYALHLGRERGIHVVRLTIEDTNTASRALSRSLGFRPIAALAHTVGLSPPGIDRAGADRIRPLSVPDVAPISPAGLPGVKGVGGCMMTTAPRPLYFVRATRRRLESEAASGRLYCLGADPRRGLFLRGAAGTTGARDGRRFRPLVPLGGDTLEIFRACSASSATERLELEGFLPVAWPSLPELERAGWRTGLGAFWGDRIHLYEVRT
jgi:GNAT superfamily N-acetyltransferase